MGVARMLMHLPEKVEKQIKGGDSNAGWEIIENQFENDFANLLKESQDENADHIQLTSKIMNLKDNLMK